MDDFMSDFPAPPKPIELLAQEGVEWAIEAIKYRVRQERNRLLSACDWTQVPDAPTDKAAWAAYRQALRDITQHPDWPNIDWPEAPK